MSGLYDHPAYYDLAFSWRDIGQEVEVLERLAREHGCADGYRVMELVCGHAPHAQTWDQRGWHYTGLDINPHMLAAAQQRAASAGRCTFIEGDLRRFALRERIDMAVVLLGSLYVQSEAELMQHLDCVAAALRPGGLYVWDWCVQFAPLDTHVDQWTVQREGVHVQVTARITPTSVAGERLFHEHLSIKVNDHGRHVELEERATRLALSLPDLMRLLCQRADFEFIGAWNRWSLDEPVAEARRINRPIVALRRLGS
ncbi:MAG: class I SAM-dependent methyltransferase [bacterium]